MPKLKPLNEYVYILEEAEEQTESGFILSKEQRTQSVGAVFAIEEDNKLKLKEGDRVIFSRFVSEDIDLKGDDGKKIKNLKACPIDSLLGLLL